MPLFADALHLWSSLFAAKGNYKGSGETSPLRGYPLGYGGTGGLAALLVFVDEGGILTLSVRCAVRRFSPDSFAVRCQACMPT